MIAREVNGERTVLLGWPCAILLQLAHPLIAAGVGQHSTFRESRLAPLQRLHATVKAMLGLTFGTPSEQEAVIARIRTIHRRVNGHLRETVGPFAAGTPYSAEDPGLVLWVHATMLDTSVRVYERTVRPLTDAERDAYCAASAPIAVALGAETGVVPRTWPELEALVTTVVGSQLAVGPDARELEHALLHAGVVRVAGVAAWPARHLTTAWLPPSVREGYGLAWSARDQRRAESIERLLRASRPWVPRAIARWR